MKIQIEEPCHENWDEMTPKEKGRFCGACQKIVLDMTKYNDQEIIDFFKDKKYNVCGQLEENQVDRELIPNRETKVSKMRKGLIAASLAGVVIGSSTIHAQNSDIPMENRETNDADTEKNDELRLDETVIFSIKGKVVDEKGKPIEGAIVLINTDKAKTGKDGKFLLSLGLYETESLKVIANVSAKGKDSQSIRLQLDFDQTTVDMGKISLKKEVRHVKGKMKVVD